MWLVSTYGAVDTREGAQSYGKVTGGYMTRIQNGDAMNAPRMCGVLHMKLHYSAIEIIAAPTMDPSPSARSSDK